MKRIIAIFLFSFICLINHAQNVNFSWVRQSGGINWDRGHSIAVDATGNVYITGRFDGSTANAFVSKYNTSGILLWTKQFTGTHSYGTAITIDVSGNVLTTGLFYGTVDFDPGPGTFNLTGISDHQFISKLDADGNFIWARQIGGNVLGQNVYISSIATDSQGNVFTSGSFDGPSIDFDPGPGVYRLNSLFNWNQIFISKLDAAGNFVWAKHMEETPIGWAPHGSWATSIAVDAIGNVYTTGRFANQIDFDPGPGVFFLYHTTDWCDAFISKLNAAGNFVWAKQLKGQNPDAAATGLSIVLDASGNVFTFGAFGDTVDFDPGPGTWYLNSADGSGYISKLDAAGNFISAKPFVTGVSTILDASGNIYTTGYFGGTVDFDPGPGIFTLNAMGGADVFIAKSDNSGNFIWAKQIGGTLNDLGYSIALDASRNIYTTGYFNEQVDFDPGPGIYNLTSAGSEDVFVLKLSQCANSTSSTITASACSTYTLNGQTYTASGVYMQTLINVAGCDSIITLNLTINRISTIINQGACGTYTWNNNTYSTSGAYSDTLVAANGCDSVVTLHLTINRIYTAINDAGCNSYTWNSNTYNTSGVYSDTLVTLNGCDSIVTLHLTINKQSFSTITQSICPGQSYLGHGTSGTYIDTLVAINGCDSIRTLQLTVLPKPAPDLGVDKEICSGDSIILYPGLFNTYNWQNGSTQNRIVAKKPGLYFVDVTNNCGSATDEILINEGICDIYFPSAFTPNNDGKNDWFKILGGYNLKDFHLVVYNRWGETIFETNDFTKGWGGKAKGQLQDSGIFIWYCEFNKPGNVNRIRMKGTVMLIR